MSYGCSSTLVKNSNRYSNLLIKGTLFFISEDFVRNLGALGWLDWPALDPSISEFRKRTVAIKIKPSCSTLGRVWALTVLVHLNSVYGHQVIGAYLLADG